MSTLITLAAEYNTQPYELAALCDLNDLAHSVELDDETVEFIREVVAVNAAAIAGH